MDDAATTLIVARASPAPMDSTKDQNATGSNAGPERRAVPASEDAPRGTTSQLEPELRGKPKRGSRLSGDS
jgi:hypothetical protein